MTQQFEIDIDSIMLTFAAECDERLAEMEQAIVGLESHPENQELLETIFRNAHTIKGNASSLGIAVVAAFTHGLENLLQRFRGGLISVTRPRITLLLRSVDALREMLRPANAGAEELKAEHAELLDRFVEKDSGADGEECATRTGWIAESLSTRAVRRNPTTAGAERNETIRVGIQKLDRMLNLAGEIAIAQGRLRQMLEKRETQKQEAENAFEAHEHLERLSLDLQEEIMKVRMVPLGPIFRQYTRVVRDVSAAADKEARLALAGEEVEIDLSVVEHIKDPLTHMIRNAIDHGIESPAKRRELGKSPCGLLTLRAFHNSGSIVIELSDDGAGLNRELIAARAKELNLVMSADRLSDQEIFQCVFEPGFSTASAVTGLSGRGIGMDIVRREIEAVRGSITLASQFGKGTTITIRVPLTLAIIDGFGVGVGDDTCILPLHAICECLPFADGQRNSENGRGMINLRGEPMPYVTLRCGFGLEASAHARESMVVVSCEGVRVGLVVDALYGPRQTVIKPLDKQFFRSSSIAGSAILDNGNVALILDIPSLLRDAIQRPGQAPFVSRPSFAEERWCRGNMPANKGEKHA